MFVVKDKALALEREKMVSVWYALIMFGCCMISPYSHGKGLFIEKHLAKKPKKISSPRERDRVLLYVSGERVSKLKIYFC